MTQTSLEQLVEFWTHRIERDLAPFTDPGVKLEIEDNGRTIAARWRQQGFEREAGFTIGLDTGVRVVAGGRTLGYREFLAGPDMADLPGLAKMILQASQPQAFVATRARIEDGQNNSEGPASEVLERALGDPARQLATLIVMVTGEAGAGKTSVLQYLVRSSAQSFSVRKSDRLMLYVNAQGRALARFNEALATELQDLRARFTYHAVAALVRNDLLIPVIDGFDELLGVNGYDDAFSALAGFVEELEGSGRIVASARSSYYEQEFVARANRVSSLGAQVWHQIPVRVESWGAKEVSEYVDAVATQALGSVSDITALKARLTTLTGGKNRHLLEKPFFVARIVDLATNGRDVTESDDLIKTIVEAYLERERTEKLLGRNGAPMLTSAQLESLLVNLAEEMWNQETRELDKRSVREVAEYVLQTESADPSIQSAVIERMPSLAFLAPGRAAGSVAFEHETFFAYFLARRFAESLASGKSLSEVLLGRSVLPKEVAEFGVLFMRGKGMSVQGVLDRLGQVGAASGTRGGQVRENAGILASELLCQSAQVEELSDLRIWGVIVPGQSWRGVVLKRARLENMTLRRTDLTTTRLLDCEAKEVFLMEVLVDPSFTRLELRGLDAAREVLGLRRLQTGTGVEVLFDPEKIQVVLEQVGAVASLSESDSAFRRVDSHVKVLVERLARAYARSNPICTADDLLQRIFADPIWPKVQRILEETEVVVAETRNASGSSKTFIRRQVLPEEIMAGARVAAKVPPSVERLWSRLEEAFPPGQ